MEDENRRLKKLLAEAMTMRPRPFRHQRRDRQDQAGRQASCDPVTVGSWVPDWLDPAGFKEGTIYGRWYDCDPNPMRLLDGCRCRMCASICQSIRRSSGPKSVRRS